MLPLFSPTSLTLAADYFASDVPQSYGSELRRVYLGNLLNRQTHFTTVRRAATVLLGRHTTALANQSDSNPLKRLMSKEASEKHEWSSPFTEQTRKRPEAVGEHAQFFVNELNAQRTLLKGYWKL